MRRRGGPDFWRVFRSCENSQDGNVPRFLKLRFLELLHDGCVHSLLEIRSACEAHLFELQQRRVIR
jgi:hypothetical protein